MAGKSQYQFAVTHPRHGIVSVQAGDNIGAARAAATAWGIQKWTEIARDIDIRRLGKVSEKKKRK